MKIAVFGSYRSQKDSIDKFIDACHDLGEKICEYGHSIIIATEEDYTADRYIVEGILNRYKVRPSETKIFINTLENYNNNLFRNHSMESLKIFIRMAETESSWGNVQLQAINEADIILLIGGSRRTYQVGKASIAANKNVVPIGSFDGASKEIHKLIEMKYKNQQDSRLNKLRTIVGNWSSEVLDSVVELLDLNYPRLIIIHGRSNDYQKVKDYLIDDLKLPTPIILKEEYGDGKTIAKKWELYAKIAHGAIAIATPDNECTSLYNPDGTVATKTEHINCARENVWLEIGWFWGKLGRKRFMILRKNGTHLLSDLQIETYNYDEDPLIQKDNINRFITKLKE